MGLTAWMVSGAVISDFVSHPDPGGHFWHFWLGRRKLFAPCKVFHFQNLSCTLLRAQSLVIVLGCWERQPQTISLGLKLLLNLVHSFVYFEGRNGEPSSGMHLKCSKPCFQQVPIPMAMAISSGLLGLTH